jgi:predicted porin
MNKKLMAVAVAGALTAPGLAVAQVGGSPGVSLYGRLDSAVMIQNFSDNGVQSGGGVGIVSVKKNDIFSPGNALGFRGREDLGGGTAAWFQLEAGVWPDGRLDAAATTGAQFGGRNSGVGFSSALGDVLFGIWDTPYKVTYGTGNLVNSGGFASSGIIMGNGDTTGALNNPMCATALNNGTGSLTTGANGVCATEATSSGTAFSRRINNSIQYWSPVFSGVQFRLMTALANYQSPDSSQPNGTPKMKEYSGNVTWARGPLALAFGLDSHEGLRPTPGAGGVVPAGGVPNPKDTAVQFDAKWDFGMAQVGAGIEQLKYANNAIAGAVDTGMKVSNMVINGRANAGPGQVWASWSQTPGGKSCTQPAAFNPNTGTGNLVIGSAACGSAGKAKMLTLGYDYVMSKRTKMYVAYNKIDNGISTAYYYIAGPAANNNNGTNGGLSAGTNVTTVALGIQHSF